LLQDFHNFNLETVMDSTESFL